MATPTSEFSMSVSSSQDSISRWEAPQKEKTAGSPFQAYCSTPRIGPRERVGAANIVLTGLNEARLSPLLEQLEKL
jgi:hypothetical protein